MRFGLRALGAGGEVRPAVAPLFLSRVSGRVAEDLHRPPGNALLDGEPPPDAAGTTPRASLFSRRSPELLSHSPAPVRETAPSFPGPENPPLRAPDARTRLAAPSAEDGTEVRRTSSAHEPIRQSVPASARARSKDFAAEMDPSPAPREGTFTRRRREAGHPEGVPLREPLIAPDRGLDHALSSTAEREVAAALSRLRRLDSTRAPSPEERIVRISIGRIDVRAVSAPPPASDSPRLRKPARPTPSLAEYLARKGRGTP